jgi:hypothetical protein
MKALTVRQPWAWAIARGHKPIENRSWTTSYRGPLAIHAAAKWDDDPEDALRTVVARVRAQGGTLPKTLADDLPYSGTGRIVAVVQFGDICTAMFGCDCGAWIWPGANHWQFADAQPIDGPVVRGRLGLWDVDLEAGTL